MIGPIDLLSKEPSKTFTATAMSSSVEKRDGWKISKLAKSCLCTLQRALGVEIETWWR